MTKSGITIGLLWHSATSANLGLGALTISQIAIVEKIAAEIDLPVRFVILGWRDPGQSYVPAGNVEIFGMRRWNLYSPTGLFSVVRRCDIVLDIGAGDSFADIYGPERIRLMLFSKFVVHAARRPMILSPQTIGPFTRAWARAGALASIRRCRAVFTRDALSTGYLREMGFRSVIGEATDVAMRLPYDPPPPRADGRVRVGLNVSGLLMAGGYTRNNMFGLKADYPVLIREILADMTARPEVDLHLVAHVIPGDDSVENDHTANVALAAEFPGVTLSPRFANPSEAKGYIAGLDFFMGARMHACIAAFSSGVPVIPMAYSRKFAGLFGTLGYDRTVDCTTEDNAAILARVRAGFETRETLAAEVRAAFAAADARLKTYEDVLRVALREVAGA